MYQGKIGAPSVWFLISCIMILYLKEKGHGIEIKTSIKGEDFKLETMMFVNNGYFNTSRKTTDIQWEDVTRQHQITVDDWSGLLRISVGNINRIKDTGILLDGCGQTVKQACSHMRMQETFILPKDKVNRFLLRT